MLQLLLNRFFPPAYRAILTDVFTWRDNPVFRREQIRESRRRDRALLLLVLLTTLVAAFVLAIWALGYFREVGAFRGSVPAAFGGSYPTGFLALFSSLHFWFVLHGAQRRSYYLLLEEYRKNSLATLLCTRIPPFQLLLMATLHPFRQGMLVAAAGLPFYFWVWSLGASALDILGVYALFAMISFRPPRWALPVFAGIPAEEIVKRHRTGRPKTWGEFWLYNSFWMTLFGSWYLRWAFGPGWVSKLVLPLATLLPRDVSQILPGFVITWVLAIVRFLWNPLPWYGMTLPPIAVFLPLFLFARLLAIWESSIQLRSGDADTTRSLWDLPEYWRMRRAHGVALPFLVLGFLWRPYVESGIASVLLYINGGARDAAVAGLLYVAGALAALVCWARAREASSARASFGGDPGWSFPGATVERSPARDAWQIVSSVVTIYILFAAACLLSGTAPALAQALRILGPMLALTLSGALLARGLSQEKRSYYLMLFVPLAAWLVPLGEAGGYIASLSPLAGLLSLTEQTQRILNEIPFAKTVVAPWFASSLTAATLGLWLNRPRGTGRTRSAPAEPRIGIHPPENSPPVIVAQPVDYVPSLQNVEAQPITTRRFRRREDTPTALRFIAWLQRRWDNAVATRELRVLLRGHLGRDEQIVFGALLVAVTLLVVYRADLAGAFLQAPAYLLFGDAVPDLSRGSSAGWGAATIFGGLAASFLVLMTLIAPSVAVSVCSTAFGRERDKSTLGFVLATPLPTRAILQGKLFGMLIPSAILVVVTGTWCVLLCLPVMTEIGPRATLTGLFFGFSVCGLLMMLGSVFGLASSTMFRRESDAGGFAFLFLFAAVIGVSYLTGTRYDLPALFGIPGPTRWTWVAYLALSAAVLVPAGLAFTHWRLTRARRGDIAMESATK